MVKSCVAYKCSNVWKPNQGIQYHRFPIKRPDILASWIKAVRLKNFSPNNHSLLCSQHFTEDSYSQSTLTKKRLRADAVPSIFNFPSYYENAYNSKRKQLDIVLEMKKPMKDVESSSSIIPLYVEVSTQTSPKKVKIPEVLKKNQKIRILQQRLKRRNLRICSLRDLIKVLKEKIKVAKTPNKRRSESRSD